jgi:SAM-dependent methyltransferase
VDEVFDQIYAAKVWGKGSGEGSDPAYCRRYVEILQRIIHDCGIRSVLDVGCGDWLQGFSRYVQWGDIRYMGIDVVSSVVDLNQQAFGSERIQFRHGNIAACDLPAADLILVKDVLQHWSNAGVLQLLPRLMNFKFALVTNDLFSSMTCVLNQNIPDGDYRPIDIMAPPFNVAGTEVMLYTNATYHPAEPVRWLKKMIFIKN